MPAMAAIATIPTPAPIPACAPVERPLLPLDSEGVELGKAPVLVGSAAKVDEAVAVKDALLALYCDCRSAGEGALTTILVGFLHRKSPLEVSPQQCQTPDVLL